jgi:hypothetical protein
LLLVHLLPICLVFWPCKLILYKKKKEKESVTNYDYQKSEPIFTPETEYLYICVYFVVSLVAYIHWAVRVIDSICTYLGISCLSIPEQKKGI